VTIRFNLPPVPPGRPLGRPVHQPGG
jgi:hypothetical protein